jgi:hypothetical protein
MDFNLLAFSYTISQFIKLCQLFFVELALKTWRTDNPVRGMGRHPVKKVSD